MYFQTAVGDNEARLLSILEIARNRSNLVILTGGLGPTEDDLTKQTLAKFLNRRLVFDRMATEKLDCFFASRPDYARTPNNDRQDSDSGRIRLLSKTKPDLRWEA